MRFKLPSRAFRRQLGLALLGGAACLFAMFSFMCLLVFAVGDLGTIRGLG